MTEYFEKVVEWKSYGWQEGGVDVSHLVSFLLGVGFTFFLYGVFISDVLIVLIGGGVVFLSTISGFLKTRKVYWRKIK